MADQEFSFVGTDYPDIIKGVPIGRGWGFSLGFRVLVDVVDGDNLHVSLRVPSDEHWYVPWWYVDDVTSDSGFPNGWTCLSAALKLDRHLSPFVTAGGTAPGPWAVDESSSTVWNFCQAASLVYWEERVLASGIEGFAQRLIAGMEPTYCFPRWPAQSLFTVTSLDADKSSGGGRVWQLNLQVVRFRMPQAQMNTLRNIEPDFLQLDSHMAAQAPILGQ